MGGTLTVVGDEEIEVAGGENHGGEPVVGENEPAPAEKGGRSVEYEGGIGSLR